MIIFDADHPLVLDGSHDREGYTPRERRAQARRHTDNRKGKTTMRFFDEEKVGVYLDHIDHRTEKTKDGKEIKMVDLTLRVQPLTPELAVSLDPDVRALLFNLSDAKPKAKVKSMSFALTVPRQVLTVRLLPETEGQTVFADVEITDVRARAEKGVDGFGLVFYAAYGPASPRDLEYVVAWLTQQRFVTFEAQAPALNFEGKAEETIEPEPARRLPRRNLREVPIAAGDEVRPGVEAEH
jgi:hypothetical protein